MTDLKSLEALAAREVADHPEPDRVEEAMRRLRSLTRAELLELHRRLGLHLRAAPASLPMMGQE